MRRWNDVQSVLPFDQAFPILEVDGKAIKEVGKSADGRWEVPRNGTLSFRFLLPKSLQGAEEETSDGFRIRPQDHHRRLLAPDMEKKVLRVASTCQCLTSLEAVIHALAADFRVRGAVATTLCMWLGKMGIEGIPARLAAAEVLYDGVADTACEMEFLHMFTVPRLQAIRSALRDQRSTTEFVVSANPTGHYVLNLTWPSERIVAEDLLVLSIWTSEMAKTTCAPDVSQRGNYQYLRNESLDGKSFVYRTDWLLPTSGMLEFDLVIPKRLPKTSKVLDEEVFQQLKTALVSDPTPVILRALCLRKVSPKLIINAQQALTLFTVLIKADGGSSGKKPLGGYPSQVELAVLSILVFRIRDYHNTRLTFFKAPGPFSCIERLRTCERFLGCLNIADPMHLNLELQLDLAVHEERQYCRMVLSIAYQEGNRTLDSKSFRGCAYGHGNPELTPFASEAPPDRWVKQGLPQRGVLVMNYLAEDGNIRFRKRQAQNICGWEL
jgi:hypothetical protein